MIDVKVVADSINVATKDRLTTFLLTYPRYIHAEVMTHRVFSRNAASSRAIPVTKFREDVFNNPVMPQHWGANQKGMQAADELDDTEEKWTFQPYVADVDGSDLPRMMVTSRKLAELKWLEARDQMLTIHKCFATVGLHKQISNRILEPWFHIQLLVSATEFVNYFALRCHKDAHPDIQGLADMMLYHYMTSQPALKSPGEWHLPYGDQELPTILGEMERAKICVARAARISYKTFEGKIDLEADYELHDRLMKSGHMSPFEHAARACAYGSWIGNFRGWEQYRKMLSGENKVVDLAKLWEERKQYGTGYAYGKAPEKVATQTPA